MAKSTITAYPIADVITGEEWLVLVQAATTKRATVSNVVASEVAVHAALPGAHQDLVTLTEEAQFLLALSGQEIDLATLAIGQANLFAASPDGAGGQVAMRAIAPDDMPLALESEPGAVELATVAEAVAMTAGTVITAQRLRNAAPAAPAADLIVCLDSSGHLIMPAAGEIRLKTGYSVGIAGSDERIEFYDDSRVAVMGANLSVGIATGDGTLHAHESSGGGVEAATSAKTIVAEGDTAPGMSILGPDNQDLTYGFTTPTTTGALAAYLKYNHNNNLLTLATNAADDEIAFLTAAGVEAARFDANGNLVMAAGHDIHMLDETYIGVDTAERIEFYTAGLIAMMGAQASIGSASLNANMTVGLTIDQGEYDDEALNIRSSDVGGVLSSVETGTYHTVGKLAGAAGGLVISGYHDGSAATDIGLILQAYTAGSANTVKTTAARALMELRGFQTDGSAIENTVADGNVLAVVTEREGSTITTHWFDEDGDFGYNGSLVSYDHLADEEMARDVQLVLTGRQGARYNIDAMVKAGILHPSEHGIMVSHKKMTALQLGAHAQAYDDRRKLEARIEYLERQLEGVQ